MKRNKIIYWTSTGIISVLMLFGAYSGFTNPQFPAIYKHLGYPDYFRVQLSVAEVLGVLVLLIPKFPNKVKEWAYAGFGITFISASIAHKCSNDPFINVLAPLIYFSILILSYIYFHKIRVVK
jgi:hypothetical protein